MIRLLLLIPTLDRSGAEKQLTLLATHLPRDEFDVHVAALTRGGPFEQALGEQQVPLSILQKRFKVDPFAFWRLRRLIRDLRPDVLHTWLFAANAYGRLAAGPTPRFPVIVSERCVDSWKSGWQLKLDRWLAGADSTARRQLAERRRVLQGERISRRAAGGDSERNCDSETAPGERERLRAEFGVPAASRVIGFVGRLARQKRIEDLIWAFELVRVLQQDVVMIIAGDGPERSRLEEVARSIQVHDRIRFLGHRDDAARLMPMFDLFWLASDFEGQSNSIMEAMAAGRPVVASDIPSNRELVIPGRRGFWRRSAIGWRSLNSPKPC